MSNTKLKLMADNPPRDPTRAKLAETIARIRDAEQRFATNEERINTLFDRSFAAQDAVDAAAVAIEKVREDQLAYLADSSLPEPVMTARQARQKHIDAEETLADIRAARKLAEDHRRVLEGSLAISRVSLREDIAAVFRDDHGVHAICGRFAGHFREFVSMRRALTFLDSCGALPDEYKDILAEREWPELPGERPWSQAYAELEQNADTQLPGAK